eukprot:2290501-Pyramimonas_sp.AAC.1
MEGEAGHGGCRSSYDEEEKDEEEEEEEEEEEGGRDGSSGLQLRTRPGRTWVKPRSAVRGVHHLPYLLARTLHTNHPSCICTTYICTLFPPFLLRLPPSSSPLTGNHSSSSPFPPSLRVPPPVGPTPSLGAESSCSPSPPAGRPRSTNIAASSSSGPT